MASWLLTDPLTLLATVLSAVVVYAVLVGLVRLIGLRSFSKMTSVDFAMTIAIGSVLASTILGASPSLLQAAVALSSLFGIQYLVARLRKDSDVVEDIVDNDPVVLMAGDRILRDNLAKTRVTEGDLWAKLREANVLDPCEVRAVVLETTGDISVLHGDPDGRDLHPCVLRGVQSAEALDLGPDDYDG